MKRKCTFKGFRLFFALLLFAVASAYGQYSNPEMENQVRQLVNLGDYDALVKLTDTQETLWKTSPSEAYFRNMRSIGDVLTGATNNRIYWLGRKVVWNMLSKPVPNEHQAAQAVRLWKKDLLSGGAESLTPYVVGLSNEEFAVVRHDTFLVLTEYARQLHATIIPTYKYKFAGATNAPEYDPRENPYKQNGIDNEVQTQANNAISDLPIDHVNYLETAYSHEPKDPQELKQILDTLNIQGSDRYIDTTRYDGFAI